MNAFVYILLCKNGKYYTGSTTDLERRIAQHISGEGANYTKKYKVQKLVYVEQFMSIEQAYRREKQIQGWSRKKKEALINNNLDLLKELSKSYSSIIKNNPLKIN